MAGAEVPTVLIVEDEPAQREVLAYNLEAEGFRV
ncbi:MAG: DNA-binding response regulator, partial [Pseudorhodobacter sp.]|nr:DNA-binding response regulator [Pseudorhodobacter sp.]